MTDLIERDLELPADPTQVWRAITDPAWLAAWLAEEVSLELWPGGQASFVVEGEPRDGWVEEARAPRDGHPGRLTFWWQGGDGAASRVSLELVPTDDGTRLRVVEARPLEVLDLVGMPLGEIGDGPRFGPALVAA